MELHVHVGYTIMLLILFRLLWGFIGSHYARFSEFLVSPMESLKYTRELLTGKVRRYLGHNPAGATMIVFLMLAIFITTLSGICLIALEGRGPLSNTFVVSLSGGMLKRIHELSADLSIVLVIIHVLGVMYSSIIGKENLSKSMLTGLKEEHLANND